VSYAGAATDSGTYSDGPLGIADGSLFTSGGASLALPPSEPFKVSQENNLPGDPLQRDLVPVHLRIGRVSGVRGWRVQ
jgi:hypothetical protein